MNLNERVFSCFTMLVTVSKGRLQFLTVNLMSARVRQFETLRVPNDNVRGGGGNGRGIIHK